MTDPQRVNIGKQHPAAYKTLIALSSQVEEATTAAGLDPLLVELLRIRTSQWAVRESLSWSVVACWCGGGAESAGPRLVLW
ncbi:hypothetical protein [Streptomyces sp. NPDC093984]|uniref:hypothetical protein n=1 Tax=Streptomyces sp. NPDC093984 TaxID=3366052 RepID=UPI0037FE3071